MLTEFDRSRYQRNVLVPGFGEKGQLLLAKARVCLVGAGGLGSPVAYYLAAAGVGALGIVDSDRVELSNLQRQILHGTTDVGRLKTESAAERIAALNPDVALQTIPERLTAENAEAILSAYDVVVEASDNFATKYLINDTCLVLRKPFATAGILSMSGQGMFVAPGQTACLRCVVAEPPENVPTTAELGVLGAVPGILGSLEALEVIRYLTGYWKPSPNGEVLVHSVDGDGPRLRTMACPRRETCRCAPLWRD